MNKRKKAFLEDIKNANINVNDMCTCFLKEVFFAILGRTSCVMSDDMIRIALNDALRRWNEELEKIVEGQAEMKEIEESW